MDKLKLKKILNRYRIDWKKIYKQQATDSALRRERALAKAEMDKLKLKKILNRKEKPALTKDQAYDKQLNELLGTRKNKGKVQKTVLKTKKKQAGKKKPETEPVEEIPITRQQVPGNIAYTEIILPETAYMPPHAKGTVFPSLVAPAFIAKLRNTQRSIRLPQVKPISKVQPLERVSHAYASQSGQRMSDISKIGTSPTERIKMQPATRQQPTSKPRVRQDVRARTMTRSMQTQSAIEDLQQKQLTSQATKPASITKQALVQPQPKPSIVSFTGPRPKTPPPIPLPEIDKKSIERYRQAYDVQVRHRGKFIKANVDPLTKDNALSLGAEIVDNSSAATFRIMKAKGRPVDKYIPPFSRIKDKYYKKGNLYIEENKNRIDTLGELQGITAKGLIAKRKKDAYNKLIGGASMAKKRKKRSTRKKSTRRRKKRRK